MIQPRIDDEKICRDVKKLADEENRSIANMSEQLLKEALAARKANDQRAGFQQGIIGTR